MKYPEYMYSHDYKNNCTIIKWGEGGYYKTDYPAGKYDDAIVDKLNARNGYTPAEREAMEICSMVAQDNPDLDWEKHYDMILERKQGKKEPDDTSDDLILPEYNGRK